MFSAKNYPITIAEMSQFYQEADAILTEDERREFIDFISTNPDMGDVIPGTGGIRKIRWPAKSQGKRSGARIIYYFRDLNMPLYLLAIYAKKQKLDLTAAEKKRMRLMVQEIIEFHNVRWLRIVQNNAS